jgi:mono/diheme cytochrome c family protein
MPLQLKVALLLMTAVAVLPAGEAVTPERARFFENEIRPLLAENCHKCHGPKEQKGSLRLDSLEAAVAGGESGPAVVPGKPAESLLIDAINHGSREMPPDGKLKEEQIAALTRWIELGAPWPGSDAPSTTVARGPREITDEDRSWWSFQPVQHPTPPEVEGEAPIQNDVDRFIAARLRTEGLRFSPAADKPTLIRRATFDLHGLPPTPEEVAAFVADDSPQAYEHVINRLLDNPRYGERWARHWLDLVRYAESDGYKADDYRPTAWRYRDYVISALNADKPYDQFIKEQLAGDEIAPDDPQAIVATGYLQLGIYEYNQRDVPTQWHAILNEMTDVTADVFLGQGLQCARCHDHKFDPLLQKDYFRLRAFFAAYSPQVGAPVATPAEKAAYAEQLAAWEAKTAEIRSELETLEKPFRDAIANDAIKKFPDDMRAVLEKKAEDRSPGDQQLYDLAWRQVVLETDKIDFSKKLKDEKLARWQELKKQLAEFDKDKPQPLPTAPAGSDIGPVAPPTLIPGKRNAEPVEPGPLSVLDSRPTVVPTPPLDARTTGRRKALAEWIASESNPLTARVMVNRLWQYHFGRGLVATSSDFGHLGELPSHPELLDYLASEFMASGWSLKKLHRLIMTSHAYRQASATNEPGVTKDPLNRLLWRQSVRRLDAEQIRDAILAATGELKLDAGGPSVDVKEPRRTIYTKQFRNRRDPLLDVFDVPDGIASTPQRNVTTTPLQSLLLINNPWMIDRANALARRLSQNSPDDASLAQSIFQTLFARQATADEQAKVAEFLQQGTQRFADKESEARQYAIADLCHALLNANEFLFVD